MQLNYLAIFLATIAQFAVGFVWYGPLFGALWGKIHGFDKLSKDVQDKMMGQMGPLYGAQLFVTIITTAVLALFISVLPQDWSPYGLAGFFWLGFVVPTQVSSVIFGGTPSQWICTKIAGMAGGSLVCLQGAADTIHFRG